MNNSSLPLSSSIKTNIFNEQYLYSINQDSFSKVSAQAIFDAEFKQKIFSENSLYIFIGTDSGLLPKYILQHGIPSGTRYLFIEPDKILLELHQHHLLDSLPTEIICTTYSQWELESEKLKFPQYSYINAVNLKSAICAQQDSSEEYSELNWLLNTSVQTTHWKHSIQISNELFIIRQMENIADNQLPATILKDCFIGKTAIILAGGPSLDDILPWVKENRQNLAVFCVSRVAKQLLNVKITPDFIFSVDPQKISFDIAHEMFQFNEKPIFINGYHAYPTLLNQWQGVNLYLGDRLPWKSPLNIPNMSSKGPTVTNTALATADYLGFDTILLAGLDLCHSKNGITHALGSAEQLAGPKYNTTSPQVKTYNNEERSTDDGYYLALQALASQAEPMLKNNKKIINLSKNAAKAEGIIHIPPKDIVLNSQSEKTCEVAHGKVNEYTINFSDDTYFSEILAELEKANRDINKVLKLAKKANKINDYMYNENGIIENYKDKKKLDKIEKTLNRSYKSYSFLIKKFSARHFLKISSPHDDGSNWDAEKAQKIGAIYYDAYEKGASTLSQKISKAIQSIKARQEEKKKTPDFALLFKQWNEDHSYNRAQLWRKNNPNTTISIETSEELALFSKKFTQYTKNSFSDWVSKRKEVLGNISFLKNKAKILFKNKRLTELKELQNKLLADKKNNEKKEYSFLISAYIATLEKDYTLALDYFHRIIDINNTPLLEEALNNITSISINQENHQNAFLALECLTQISPIYLPFYAESARILGEIILAIDSYITYISSFPDDVVTQLKLTSLYISQGIDQAAELMLDLILKKHPDLEAALTLKKQISSTLDMPALQK